MKGHPCTGFYASFLGGFSLSYGGREIRLHPNLRNISMQMLLMLLKAGTEGVEKRSLLAIVRPEERELKKRQNNFRQQIHILRRLIENSDFPKGDYVVLEGSRYYFTQEHEIRTDTQRLDGLIQKLKNGALDKKEGWDEEVQELYKGYCQAYTGEFLPMLGGEEWVAVESAFYQSWYVTCLSGRCQVLKEQGQYETMLELCTIASHIHPYDEWQATQIECLMAMDRYREALEVYEEATEIFYKDLGVTSLDRVMARYRGMKKEQVCSANTLAKLQRDLEEKDKGEDGPYYCGYPSFQDACRLIARMAERTGSKNVLLLCTLTESGGAQTAGVVRVGRWPVPDDGEGLRTEGRREGERTAPEVSEGERDKDLVILEKEADASRELEQEMLELKGILVDRTRREDIYTRYSQNQYLALLVGAGEEGGKLVIKRLGQAWKLYGRNRKSKIRFALEELEGAVSKGAEDEEKGDIWRIYR